MFGFEAAGTVYSRVGRLASSDGLVGYALDALREAFFSEQASRLILVEYQALTRAPRDTMQHLYRMLDEPYFEHDFDNVEYQAEDFDSALGARGLHTVKRKVEWSERATILPPGLFERYTGDAFWREPQSNIRGAAMIQLT
jgi:sulfotransferase